MGDAAAADERLGDLHSVAPVDGFGQRVGDGNLRGVPHRCFIMRLTINPDGDEDQMSERPPAALPRRRQGRHGPFPPVRPEDEGLAEFGSGGRLGHEDGRRLQCLGGLLAQSGASGIGVKPLGRPAVQILRSVMQNSRAAANIQKGPMSIGRRQAPALMFLS